MLHPASVVVNLLPQTWRVIRSFWPLGLAILWRGTSSSDSELWFTSAIDVSIVGVFTLLTVGGTLRHWLTLRYRISRGRLEIATGLLNRQIRTIDPARVQNVELVRTLPHRLSGLVEVRIETASGSEVEGLLSALSVPEAERIQQRLEVLRAAARPETEADGDETASEVLIENTLGDLFMYGVTAGRLGAAAIALGAVIEGLSWFNINQIDAVTTEALGFQGLAATVAILAGAWLLGLGGTILRHWGLTLTRLRRSLVVEGGLATKRRLELPLHKVQIVRTSETLVRRWLKIGSVTIETAAARSGQGGTERRAALVPVVPHEDLSRIARIAVPDLDDDPWTMALRPPHRRALTRSISRRVVQVVAVASLAGLFFSPWALVGLAAALPLAFFEWMDWRHQGWAITERVVIARRGFLNRQVVVVSRRRLQSVAVRQGLINRRLGLGVVVVKVAGSTIPLPIMGWEEAVRIVDELAHPAPIPSAPQELLQER